MSRAFGRAIFARPEVFWWRKYMILQQLRKADPFCGGPTPAAAADPA